jgi:hypothetical protein
MKSASLDQMRATYQKALRGLHFIGMLDPALYVSTQRTHSVPRFIQFHVHALVWGVRAKDLAAFFEGTRDEVSSLLPYTTSVDVKHIRDGDLLQVIWYTTKMPRKQYQLWKRESGSFQQYKRNINGANSVRLFNAIHDVTLDQLTLAGGEGTRILKLVLQDAEQW